MDKHLFDLLLFFALSIFVRLSDEGFPPGLRALGISSCLLDDSFECIDSSAHPGVKLLLDRMKVEVQILAESDAERQGLFYAL